MVECKTVYACLLLVVGKYCNMTSDADKLSIICLIWSYSHSIYIVCSVLPVFVPSPLKMRGHFQNLRDIKVYVV